MNINRFFMKKTSFCEWARFYRGVLSAFQKWLRKIREIWEKICMLPQAWNDRDQVKKMLMQKDDVIVLTNRKPGLISSQFSPCKAFFQLGLDFRTRNARRTLRTWIYVFPRALGNEAWVGNILRLGGFIELTSTRVYNIMSATFEWGTWELNKAHFNVFAHLLHLRDGEQVDLASVSNDMLADDHNVDWEVSSGDTNKAQQISISGHMSLKRKSLDCLTELAVNKKDGKTVSCNRHEKRPRIVWPSG
jgi:hypothetical protein